MASDFEVAFPRTSDRELITHPPYHVLDWRNEHYLSFPTIELALGLDGYQQLADDAAVGRAVARWRARNPELAALLDAETALDALGDRR